MQFHGRIGNHELNRLSVRQRPAEDRLADGVPITYRDVVVEYVRLSQTTGPFAQVPIRCYVNFISDFMAAEQNATREQAIKAWTTLKALDVPKDYRSWKRFRSSKAKE